MPKFIDVILTVLLSIGVIFSMKSRNSDFIYIIRFHLMVTQLRIRVKDLRCDERSKVVPNELICINKTLKFT